MWGYWLYNSKGGFIPARRLRAVGYGVCTVT